MEQDSGAGGVARGQNVVYVMPHDWASIAHFLEPLLERLDASTADLQLVVITPDPEVTAAVGAAAVRLADERGLHVAAATSSRRAGRLLRARPAQILAGDPQTLVDLIRSASLKLGTVKAVAIAWVDELLTHGGAPHLETLMSELPKDAPRAVVCAEATPAVEEVIERYARRARRVIASSGGAADRPTTIEYVTVSESTRLPALRRLLDDVDPRSALVFVRGESGDATVRELLRSLGYGAPDAPIRLGRAADPETEVVILYDLPASREELREAAGPTTKRVIALVQPRQLTSLRGLAAGGAVSPLTLPGAAERARDRDAGTRAELRGVLSRGEFGRELLTLEPLLDEYDGIEIAAAALQLLERERAARATARAAEDRPAAAAQTMARIFITVGSRDNVRPGDLVGAIANAANISSADIGKVDVRESHSLVDVMPHVADTVIDKVTGLSIKGRRAVARMDIERPRRPGADRAPRGAGDRPTRSPRESGERSPRGTGRPPRGRGGRERE